MRPPPGGQVEHGLGYHSAAGRWVVLATVLGSGMAALDATVVGIALPSIGREFHAGVSGLQWVVTAYLLTLTGFLLAGGALGDRLGRRRVFTAGAVWFALASLLCGVAPTTEALIAARALQGVGGALLVPGSLAILEASFVPADRSRAIGAWAGLGGVATAVGPLVGGLLIGAVSWRLVFYLNLPLALAVVVIAARHVPESRDDLASGAVDVAGTVLGAAGLVGVCFALIEGADLGWASPAVVATLTAGLAALLAFAVVERRVDGPILPVDLFRSRQFTAANLVTLVLYAGLGGTLFLLPIDLQQVAHYSPAMAGTALLPLTALMLVLSARSGALAGRIGPRLQMSVGPVVAGGGLVLLARIDASGGYVTEVLPAVIVLGLGLAATVAPLTATVLAAVSDRHSGVASAVNNDVARAGGLVAVAMVPAIAGVTGDGYLHAASLAHAFRVAAVGMGVLCAAGGLIAALGVRNPPRASAAAGGGVRRHSHCALDAPPLRSGTPRGEAVTGSGAAVTAARSPTRG